MREADFIDAHLSVPRTGYVRRADVLVQALASLTVAGVDPQSQVSAEMALIEKGDYPQQMFRNIFNMDRLNSLGGHPEGSTDLRSIIEGAAAMVRSRYPDFDPEYDPSLLSR